MKCKRFCIYKNKNYNAGDDIQPEPQHIDSMVAAGFIDAPVVAVPEKTAVYENKQATTKTKKVKQ